MAQAQTQFTPAQILEAGQRAEREGRIEHARQFYNHLVEHYAATPEAAAAQSGVARVNARDGNPSPVQNPSPAQPAANRSAVEPDFESNAQDMNAAQTRATPQANTNSSPHAAAPTNGGAQMNAPTPHAQGPHAQGQHAQGMAFDRGGADRAPVHGGDQQLGNYGAQQPPARPTSGFANAHLGNDRVDPRPASSAPGYAEYDATIDEDLLQPQSSYVMGRIGAGIVLVIGFVMVLTGIAITIVGAANATLLEALHGDGTAGGFIGMLGQTILWLGGPGFLIFGLVLCVFSQIARAVFHSSSATLQMRDVKLAQIEARMRRQR